MYNVLEKLRAGVALNAKDKLIHDQGLVSLLQQMHDDLDEAVFTAYGWVRGGRPDTALTDAEILERLVHLNAQRAEEEKRGIIHWLRPEYQNAGDKKTEVQGTLEMKPKRGQVVKGQEVKRAGAKQPWPKTLAERIRAVEAALHAAGSPVTAAELAKHFTSTQPAALQEILESLAALGRARVDGERFGV